MPSINDNLNAFLESVMGLTGLSLNDKLARINDLNYIMPPRVTADPVNPPLGAVWVNTVTGELLMQEAAGKRKVADEPPSS